MKFYRDKVMSMLPPFSPYNNYLFIDIHLSVFITFMLLILLRFPIQASIVMIFQQPVLQTLMVHHYWLVTSFPIKCYCQLFS